MPEVMPTPARCRCSHFPGPRYRPHGLALAAEESACGLGKVQGTGIASRNDLCGSALSISDEGAHNGRSLDAAHRGIEPVWNLYGMHAARRGFDVDARDLGADRLFSSWLSS